MRPVFVGGCVRSGTTMLGAMLGAHPDHVCPPEMPFKFDLLRAEAGGGLSSMDDALRLARSHWKTSALGWDIEAMRPEGGAATAAAASKAFARGYGRLHDRLSPTVWIDHSPVNVRFAATLAKAFPDASFVHVVRDGRAVTASMMRVDWGPGNALDAARLWTERIAQGLAAETALAERCVRVRFEDLVTAPETTLQGLCAGLGIEYHPDMVSGAGFQATPYIADQHALVGRPPVPARAEAWRAQLSDRDVEIFEAAVGDLLPLLGYEPRFGLRARAATRRERLRAGVERSIRSRTVDRFRKRARIRAGRRR